MSDWFDRATSAAADWPVAPLLAAKGNLRISVVIPARDEAATIGDIVGAIHKGLVQHVPLVDELVVMDSDSRDETPTIAAQAGAAVFAAAAVRPDLGAHRGKGEALWKSQFVTTGDVLVFIDGDLRRWGTHFVTGLLGPLLVDPRIGLVKGFYDRTLDDGSGAHAGQGGRVTELVARPLIGLLRPELAHLVEPLAGEWAIRRDIFAELSVPIGYGIEMATTLDVEARLGLDAIAQVDLGERDHAHQSIHDLAVMASEVAAIILRRSGTTSASSSDRLWQFDRRRVPSWLARTVPNIERPPANSFRDAWQACATRT